MRAGTSRGSGNLQSLGLGGNQITSIESGDFQGLGSLQRLELDGNQITSIEDGDFQGLGNLQELDLGENRITSMDSGDFQGLGNLQSLYLNGNQITSIESGDFQGLGNLQQLILRKNRITSIESGAFQGLGNLYNLGLSGNQITSIESGAFQGLGNLRSLYLDGNQITSIESGSFQDLNNLAHLLLYDNNLTELNLSGATFDSLGSCFVGEGFCVGGNEIFSLILDNAELSRNSFYSVLYQTSEIADASLVDLTFSDSIPANMSRLLGIATLQNVRVDERLFARYADEFNAFAAMPGKTVRVAGDFDGDRQLTVVDIDQMDTAIRTVSADLTFDLTGDGIVDLDDHSYWVHTGKDTHIGDANLDGVFNNLDLVAILQSGQYQDTIVGTSTWSTGDWNADGEFDRADLILALQDGGYGQGPRLALAAVPEPPTLAILLAGSPILATSTWRRSRRLA